MFRYRIHTQTGLQLMALFLLVLIFSSVGLSHSAKTQQTDKNTNTCNIVIHVYM